MLFYGVKDVLDYWSTTVHKPKIGYFESGASKFGIKLAKNTLDAEKESRRKNQVGSTVSGESFVE